MARSVSHSAHLAVGTQPATDSRGSACSVTTVGMEMNAHVKVTV